MRGDYSTILLGCLAVTLLVAAFVDLRERRIPNRLNILIAAMAIPFWWATGRSLWPGVPLQIMVAGCVFAFFAVPFAFGMMGGGDVKMLAALALWLPLMGVVQLLVVMSLAGGLLTLIMLARHRMARAEHQLEIPYGVAIAFAGLWLIGEPFLNQFGR
jgi:prepilin peptidase CpaA